MKKLDYISLLLFSLIIFGLLVNYLWPFTVDDAFITFRYSRNLALGFGPTWNPGEPPIEGYTTFLWMLILTIPYLFHFDIVIFSKILGIFFTLLTFPLIWVFVHEIKGTNYGASISIFLFAVLPYTALHTVAGMETGLAVFLTTLFFLLAVKGKIKILPIVGLLLALTRPEMILLVITCVILVYIKYPQQRKSIVFYTMLFLILPGSIYFIWRVQYFGHLLPLSFYIKTGSAWAGIKTILPFLGIIILIAGLPIATFFKKNSKYLLLITLPLMIHIIFFAYPEHIMGYGWRFLFPIIPMIFILAGAGYSSLKKSLSVILIFISALMLIAVSTREVRNRRVYGINLVNAHIKIGKTLAMCSPVGTVATPDAGAIPYYSNWKSIDTFGLNDVTIATTGIHDPAYILDQHPNILIVASRYRDNLEPFHQYVNGLYSAAVSRGMTRLRVYQFNRNYYLWVLGFPNTSISQCVINN